MALQPIGTRRRALKDFGDFPFETRQSNGPAICNMLLDGKWVSGSQEAREITDKYRLTTIGLLPLSGPEQIGEMIRIADERFSTDRLSPFDRGQILDRVADIVEQRSTTFLEVMQLETGYTTADCKGEISRSIQTFRLSAEEARRLAGTVVPVAGAANQTDRLAFTLRIPLGVILAVTPFNAPLNTVAHKLGPAIGAGNTVILKPAEHTPRTACLLAQAFLEAGLPAGYLQVFHGGGPEVADAMRDERVRYVAFTGSTEVGSKIQAQAGLRRTQMELGSIAFTILCADADLKRALPKIVGAGYRKAGQVCTSVQMLLVHRSILDDVCDRMTSLVKALTFGDPAKPDCVTGPLISLNDAKRVESWISAAIEQGARLLAGGSRDRSVVAPTLLSNVSRSMQVGCREIFGPVVCIESFDDLTGAIERVNSTPYGLASGIFTNQIDAGFQAARRLRVGGVHINETSSSRVDMMPYGGSKDSGFGREGPAYAIHEMTEERVVTLSL